MSYQDLTIAQDGPTVGTPVYHSSPYGDRMGWIAEVAPMPGNVYSLAEGMRRQNWNLTVVFDNDTHTTVSESIAAPWLAAATRYRMEPIAAADAADRLQLAKAKAAQERQDREAEQIRIAEVAAAFRDKYRDKIPADAQAVIVAELEHDASDIMTDYFATRTSRVVLLAFSTHKRDLFSEMRKAARNFAETADLAEAGPEAEHREKWSMGAGYYLKGGKGGRYSDGWAIRKRAIYMPQGCNDRAAGLPFGEWSIPDAAAAEPESAPRKQAKPAAGETESADLATVNGFTISAHTHTKKGFRMHIVETPGRVSADVFAARLNRAKDLRGWYSRQWGTTPAGFAFKSETDARKFAESLHHV